MNTYIYHYTHLKAAIAIAESGYLKLSQWEKENGIDPPALWLSMHPFWEFTATKLLMNENGVISPITFEEQHKQIRCLRFVLNFEEQNYLSWTAYKKVVRNTPQKMLEGMESKGISLGAQPSDWYASLKDIPISKVIACQIWDGENWQSFEINELNNLKT